mgnify:CR=1 FL=1
MTSKVDKEKFELEYFEKFAKVCPLQICPSSIQNCQPPQPDIACESKVIGKMFFELVELTDPVFNSSIISEWELRQLLEHEAQKRPEFSGKYRNACISVLFKANVKKSKKFIPKIVDLLLSECISENFEGEVLDLGNLSSKGKDFLKGWGNKLRTLEVSRVNNSDPQEPLFWTTPGMKPVDCNRVLERVKEKFEKSYNLDPVNQAELLGYFNHHPPPPIKFWLQEVNDFVKDHICDSPFTRVWFFDFRVNTLLYVYPDL